jgi:hypothetical protein
LRTKEEVGQKGKQDGEREVDVHVVRTVKKGRKKGVIVLG